MQSILTNEKYKGDALLQKRVTVDFLTKKSKVNEGEAPQYYVTGSHPAIIKAEEWDLVQLEIQRREKKNNFSSSIFAEKIICAECGGVYGSKVWHSTDKYRHIVWQCNNKYNGKKCTTPSLRDEDIKRWFSQAFSQYLEERDVVIDNMRHVQSTCLDPAETEKALEETLREMEITEGSLRQCIADNAAATITEEEYRKRYEHLYEKFQRLESEKADLTEKLTGLKTESASFDELITLLENTEGVPIEFNPSVWRIVVEKVLVRKDGTVLFQLAGGREYSFTIY